MTYPVSLIPIKLKVAAKCSVCTKEQKKGWNAYATNDKKVVCRYCAPKIGDNRVILLEILTTLGIMASQNRDNAEAAIGDQLPEDTGEATGEATGTLTSDDLPF